MRMWNRVLGTAAVLLLTLGGTGPAAARQVRTIDPNSAIDADLPTRPQAATPARPRAPAPAATPAPTPTPRIEASEPVDPGSDANASAGDTAASTVSGAPLPDRALAADAGPTYKRDDVIAAGEGVFGKGAAGLGGLVEKILREQGEPNAYIAGREVSGAFVVGLRYGSGVMTHRVEGERKVYWTGPSLGFDVGGDAAKVFVLVYNLYDSQELFRRFPAVEGRMYLVGGFAATYLRRGNVVLIPIHLGVGWRLGANVGYMRFTERSRLLPF